MFYVGSHNGKTTDGYVGSNLRLKRAYAKRPEDFKRKILEFNTSRDPNFTRILEEKWLNLIKPTELGIKYYNLKRVAGGGNLIEGMEASKLQAYKKKLSDSRKGEKHWAARAVIVEGTRYQTLAEAEKAVGMKITKRLNSRLSKWKNWYFEDTGPFSDEEISAYEDQKAKKLARHISKVANLNKRRPKEWHLKRMSSLKGKTRPLHIGDAISKKLRNNTHNVRAVRCVQDGNEFPCIRRAAEHYKLHTRSISLVCQGRLRSTGADKLVFEYLKP